MSAARTDLIAQRTADAKVARSLDGRRDRIEAELSKLAGIRPAATVKADIDGLLLDPRVGDCSVMDGPRSKAACPRVASLRAELGQAERKAQLEVGLTGLQTAAPATTDKAADPGAHALSVYLAALGLILPERLLTDWLTLIPVLALEIGAAVSLLLVQAVSGGKTGHETPRQIEQKPDSPDQARPAQPQTASPDTKSGSVPAIPASLPSVPPTKGRTPRTAKKRTRKNGGDRGGGGQSGKRRLGNVVDLLKARGGRIEGGQRGIAKTLGLSKSRVNEVLHELAAAGAVRLATSRAGTMVSLAA